MIHELVITVLPEGSGQQEIFVSNDPLPWPNVGEKVKLGPCDPAYTVASVEHHIGRAQGGKLSLVTYVEIEP